jgi:hypothetical protein
VPYRQETDNRHKRTRQRSPTTRNTRQLQDFPQESTRQRSRPEMEHATMIASSRNMQTDTTTPPGDARDRGRAPDTSNRHRSTESRITKDKHQEMHATEVALRTHQTETEATEIKNTRRCTRQRSRSNKIMQERKKETGLRHTRDLLQTQRRQVLDNDIITGPISATIHASWH